MTVSPIQKESTKPKDNQCDTHPKRSSKLSAPPKRYQSRSFSEMIVLPRNANNQNPISEITSALHHNIKGFGLGLVSQLLHFQLTVDCSSSSDDQSGFPFGESQQVLLMPS